MSNRVDKPRRIGQRKKILLCWFIPALAAFGNATALFVKTPPPLVVTVPVRPVTFEKSKSAGDIPLNLVKMEGTAEFTNTHRGTLTVAVRDRLFAVAPPYNIEVLRDGAHQDFMLNNANESRQLPEGRHTYRVVASTSMEVMGSPPSGCEMTVRVDYPTHSWQWQGLGLLGLAFLLMGTLHFKKFQGP